MNPLYEKAKLRGRLLREDGDSDSDGGGWGSYGGGGNYGGYTTGSSTNLGSSGGGGGWGLSGSGLKASTEGASGYSLAGSSGGPGLKATGTVAGNTATGLGSTGLGGSKTSGSSGLGLKAPGGITAGLGSTGLGESGTADQRAVESMAAKYGVSPQAMKVALAASALNRPGLRGKVAEGGLSYGSLASLARQGYGDVEGMNPNNPTQTLSQVMASKSAHDFLNKNVAPIMGALTGNPMIGGVMSGVQAMTQGASPVDAVGRVAAGILAPAVSSAVGFAVPAAAVAAAFQGNFSAAAQATIASNVARDLGISASSVGLALQGQFGAAMADAAVQSTMRQIKEQSPALAGTISALGLPKSAAKAVSSRLGSGFSTGGTVNAGDDIVDYLQRN